MTEQLSNRKEAARKGSERDDRITLTIPYPSYIELARGIHAVNKMDGYTRTDMTSVEKDLVTAAAAYAGVTRSAFMRWVAVHAAKEIMSHENARQWEAEQLGQSDEGSS